MSGPCTCGCCRPAPVELDPHVNPPGLAAVGYRIGDWARLRARLLAGLSRQELAGGRRPLAALTGRSPEDPTIALLDAAAVLGDVLTRYQERIANEHYLRTATERRSVLELARMIGYELRPGVAAGVDLVVEVEDAPGAPGTAEVPAGTRVASVPGPGELPQAFETAAPLHARAAWNALRPRRRRAQRLAVHQDKLVRLVDTVEGDPAGAPVQIPAGELFEVTAGPGAAPAAGSTVGAEQVDRVELAGTATRLQPGDRLLVVGRTAEEKPRVATLTLLVAEVRPDPPRDRTVVALAGEPRTPQPGRPPTLPKTKPIVLGALAPFSAKAVRSRVVDTALDASTLGVLLLVNRWTLGELTAHVAALARQEPGTPGLFAFRERAGVFGATAPAFSTIPAGTPVGPDWDTAGWSIWRQHRTGDPPPLHGKADLIVERPVRGAGPGSWALVEQAGDARAYRVAGSAELASTGFAMSGRGTGLTLTAPDGTAAVKPDTFLVRSTTVHAASEPLRPAELIIDTPLDDAGVGVGTLALDGFQPDLQPGQRLAVSGEQLDAAGVTRHEIAEIERVVHLEGITYLAFTERLRHRYRRATVLLSANVVRAGHGGTEVEVLGSGDATLANQRFELRKPPVTHLPVPPTGAVPALEIRVDGVEWEPADSLHDAGPDDRRYLLRRDDDGRATVLFGDGRHGARLPTGTENVTAVYRSGLGTAGEVAAGSLTQLQTKPLGVRAVRNPVAAAGAQDPEQRDSARDNAPRQVATFDRIVSRADAEQFVRGFPGIGKAQAAVVAIGPARRIVVAAATATGRPVEESPDTAGALRAALRTVAEPALGLQLVGYRDHPFDVHATLAVDDRFRRTAEPAARAALLAGFGFARRQFAQPVSAAEVVAVLAGVPGVLGVDLDVLAPAPAPAGATGPPPPLLVAEPTSWDGERLVAPQLLTVNPLGIALHLAPADRAVTP